MKRLIILLLAAVILFACEKNEQEESIFQATGIVQLSGGLAECDTKILLDNGVTIIPANKTDFVMASDQRVVVEYEVLDKQTDCDGQECRLLSLQVLECTPYVDLNFHNYDSLKNDSVMIREVYQDGNCLVVKLSYSGGCENHIIDLARMHPWCGTPPLPPPTFEIRHDSKGDMCEAFLTTTHSFDLSPLKDEFGNEEFTIVFNANNYYEHYHEEITIKLE